MIYHRCKISINFSGQTVAWKKREPKVESGKTKFRRYAVSS